MSLRLHEISEADHRILNPFSEQKLRLLGEVCRMQPGWRLLDLACGKGEMVCQWAARHGIGAVGVDLSAVFLDAARARATELGVTDRVEFVEADAATYLATPDAHDIVSCIGATWIGGGLTGTVALMRPALRQDGLLLVGEPFWHTPPPDAAFEAFRLKPDDFVSLAGTVDRLSDAGVEVVEMILSSADDWDRYVAEQWWTLDRWLHDNSDDPEAADIRAFRDESRRTHLLYGRQYLGWGVFVGRLR